MTEPQDLFLGPIIWPRKVIPTDQAAELLRKYGQCLHTCERLKGGGGPCTCGLADTVSELEQGNGL